MVMDDDSCLKGHLFESRCHILDGHFFTLICCKSCIVGLKRLKINKKEAGVGPSYKKSSTGIIKTLPILQKKLFLNGFEQKQPRLGFHKMFLFRPYLEGRKGHKYPAKVWTIFMGAATFLINVAYLQRAYKRVLGGFNSTICKRIIQLGHF